MTIEQLTELEKKFRPFYKEYVRDISDATQGGDAEGVATAQFLSACYYFKVEYGDLLGAVKLADLFQLAIAVPAKGDEA